jgi:DNA polymerase III sliding clamp (beta) subunit (PCNA family)
MKFIAKMKDLKKAVSIASLAVSSTFDNLKSHALFNISDNKASIFSTDEDSLAFATMPVETSDTFKFTVSPKKLMELLSGSDREYIKFEFNGEAKTLDVYASDDDEALVSFPSFDPEEFLSFEEELKNSVLMGEVDSTVFGAMLKFQQGFLDEKSQKFTNTHAKEGVSYGANGSTKIGAFLSADLEKIFTLTIRKGMISSIVSLMDNTDQDKIQIRDTEKKSLFISSDGLSGFGYRKSTAEMPKFPIETRAPNVNGISVDRTTLLKKISRLSITKSNDKLGLAINIDSDTITITTKTDRKSIERMACKRITSETEPINFVIECELLKSVLPLFATPKIDLYVYGGCYIFSNAELLIKGKTEADQVKKAYTAIARLSLPRG